MLSMKIFYYYTPTMKTSYDMSIHIVYIVFVYYKRHRLMFGLQKFVIRHRCIRILYFVNIIYNVCVYNMYEYKV